ncbi:protein-cysteine N-palmitoyltransferase HHAT isoform X3 [Nothobranchius furzeri]|uniref:Transcript variant X3 n=1 Tax=Nothobranchius furzeri TaxID=105023 RepID=A0A9D2YGN6_NOTFU|nr:protein-cysteine N-palmitoyltransferase HHAT isoform X2 [Nothobranchius furzeri]KAF7220242.1 transcript variant X3 [Nothobranchius furzeri]
MIPAFKSLSSPLPWTELLLCWLLSVGSHLYSFYQLHKFSKEHEVGFERHFHLEKGIFKGFKRDPSDFEWSFWNDWAKRSLLWTLIGHGLISRITSIFYPKLRVPALTLYGFLAASFVLGIKGVSVLLVHLGVSFSVALLRKPTLSWIFNLLLLSTIHIQTLQDIQMRMSDEDNREESALSYFLLQSGRIILWWCLAEYMIHTMYIHLIQSNETYIEILPPWALGGFALAHVQFFYVKYLVLFGLPCMLATLDELVPPKLPRCVSIMYSFTGMWRHFDEGLYRWLIRYIYIPLGGSRHGPLCKTLSTGLAFGFVCFWHGGHDYLRYWALMNWAGVLVENGLKSLFATACVRSVIEHNFSTAMQRRCVALLSAFSTAMLILSNLVFLGGIHVGRIFWKRVFVQGWSTIAPPMLVFLYCFAQVGLEWTSHPP